MKNHIIKKAFITMLILVCMIVITACNSEKNDAYESAIQLLENKQYDDAVEAFEALDGYKDSDEMILKAKYLKACDLLTDEEYELAWPIFSELENYEDSKEKSNQCSEFLKKLGKVYEDAKTSIEAGDIADAISLLNEPTIYTKEMYELAEFCNTVIPYIGDFNLERGNAPLKSSENMPPDKMTSTLSNIRIGDKSVVPQLYLNGLILLYQYDKGTFAYAGRYKQGDYVFTHSDEKYILELKTKQGEKKESVFTRISDYTVIDLNSKKVMKVKEESVDTNKGKSDNEDVTFTNKYGTPTTKCAHSGCNEYIAPSGDTNCCEEHSNKCADCGKYIDEDAMYCMDCLKKAKDANE